MVGQSRCWPYPCVELEEDAVAKIESRTAAESATEETRDESTLKRVATKGWHEAEARNQVLFREVNERIEQLAGDFGAGGQDRLICECGNPECTQQIAVTRAEYERIRGHASRFIVALNHENPETESIIEENERFAVVETYAGGASQIARDTDPRSQANWRHNH